MTADRLPALTAQLHPAAVRDELVGAIDEGPVVLAAQPGAGEIALLAAVVGRDVIRVDARTAGNQYGLLVDITRAIVARLAPGSEIGQHASAVAPQDRLALAERFGAQADDAIGAAMGLPNEGWSLDVALRGLEGAVLVVEHSHLLTQKWAQRALWALRGHAADRGVEIVLATRPWHADRLLSEDAAFFGFARRVELDAWVRAEAAEAHLPGPDMRLLLQRTSGQIAAIAEVLAAQRPGDSVEDAYAQTIADRVGVASALLSSAQAITPLGGRLLLAIAHDLPPYREATRAVPARVAGALNALRDADLIFSPEPRRWTLADQLTAVALRTATDHWRPRVAGSRWS